MPSLVCVTASLSAGRREYGSQETSGEEGAARPAISVIARYLIGAEACSRSQLNGKVSGSATGVDVGRASSVLVLGAVTSGYGRGRRLAFFVGRPAHVPAVSAGKNSRFWARR